MLIVSNMLFNFTAYDNIINVLFSSIYTSKIVKMFSGNATQ